MQAAQLALTPASSRSPTTRSLFPGTAVQFPCGSRTVGAAIDILPENTVGCVISTCITTRSTGLPRPASPMGRLGRCRIQATPRSSTTTSDLTPTPTFRAGGSTSSLGTTGTTTASPNGKPMDLTSTAVRGDISYLQP